MASCVLPSLESGALYAGDLEVSYLDDYERRNTTMWRAGIGLPNPVFTLVFLLTSLL